MQSNNIFRWQDMLAHRNINVNTPTKNLPTVATISQRRPNHNINVNTPTENLPTVATISQRRPNHNINVNTPTENLPTVATLAQPCVLAGTSSTHLPDR